jgi:hypothetical protein
MAEVQIAIEKTEVLRSQVWADLLRKAPPPWRNNQQFIDVGWDILNLLNPATEIITPDEALQHRNIGGMNLIMNHYFFPEIPIVSAVIDEVSRSLGREGIVTAVANMPQDLVIPNSVPILIPPVHYFKRYDRHSSDFKNVISGPEPLLYIFNQWGFISSDRKTRARELTSKERIAINMNSAFEMVDRMEGNQEAIIYPSGDRMPGPQHPGFLGWSLMHQYLKTGHISPVNYWVHEGFLPIDLLKGVTRGNLAPSRLICVDTTTPDELEAMARQVLSGDGISGQNDYQSLLRSSGSSFGLQLLDNFKTKIGMTYREEFPEYNWDRYLRYTSRPAEV